MRHVQMQPAGPGRKQELGTPEGVAFDADDPDAARAGVGHALHGAGLRLRRVETADDADATRSVHGDRHLGAGDGIHVGREERSGEGDTRRDNGAEIDLVAGADPGVARHQEDVVVGQAVADDGHKETPSIGGAQRIPFLFFTAWRTILSSEGLPVIALHLPARYSPAVRG